MFRALYAFNSSDPGTLNANCDDLFCGIGMDSSRLWMQVADDSGHVGYLPYNYLQFCNWAERDFAIQFVDDGIKQLQEKASIAGKYTNTQLEKLSILNTHRERLTSHYDQFIAFIKGAAKGQTFEPVPSQSHLVNPSGAAYHASTSGQSVSHNKQPVITTASTMSHNKQPAITTASTMSHNKQPAIATASTMSHNKQPANTTRQRASYKEESTKATEELVSNPQLPDHVTEQLAKPTIDIPEDDISNKDTSYTTQLTNHKSTEEVTQCATNISNSCGDGARGETKSESLSADVVAAQMTELLRDSTGLSHDKCKTGVTALLEYLVSHNVSSNQFPLICKAIEQDAPAKQTNSELNHDVVEMNAIFSTIADCKDDSQQRSWHLHEDESFISTKLSRLLEILTLGNREILVENISNELDCVHNLVLYYQMETRSSLRAIMLQIFAALCTMSSLFITNLLCSVLTLELVRDLMSTKDNQRLMYSAIVLSMLFSTGEPIPVQHNDLLSSSFVDFLLDKIEESCDVGITDVCLELLLSFNQHFTDPDSNSVLLQLSHRREATVLTQNFLKLFNSGEDPVKIIANEEQMSAVLKFATDLYSLRSTSQLIYTNDVKVLIDIIIRQLTDLSDQDKVRSDYLSLMQLLLINSNYNEHDHRKEDLLSALNQIEFNEEATTSQSEMDVRIVQEIRKML